MTSESKMGTTLELHEVRHSNISARCSGSRSYEAGVKIITNDIPLSSKKTGESNPFVTVGRSTPQGSGWPQENLGAAPFRLDFKQESL